MASVGVLRLASLAQNDSLIRLASLAQNDSLNGSVLPTGRTDLLRRFSLVLCRAPLARPTPLAASSSALPS
jgi:hypothetical protein